MIHSKNIFRQAGKFQGGLYLPKRPDLAVVEKICDIPTPDDLLVPLIQHEGSASRACVQPGQKVEAGQLIGQRQTTGSLNIHAPLPGLVTAIERVDTAQRQDVPAIKIKIDQQHTGASSTSSQTKAIENLTIEELADVADKAGLTDMRSPAEPLGEQLRQAYRRPVTDIIINTLSMEPEFSWINRLLDVSDAELSKTIGSLQKIVAPDRVWIAVDHKDRRRYSNWRKLSAHHTFHVIGLDNKYPQAHPVLLTKVITNRETPAGGDTIQAGVLIIELSAVAALHKAGRQGFVFTHRPMLIAGSVVSRPGIYRVPFGTRILDLLQTVEMKSSISRIFDGGLLTGRAIDNPEIVVTGETAAVIAMDHEKDWISQPGPCVRCGWCQEDCPVGLDPQRLLEIYERGSPADAAALHPEACIECGLCSYVCPAELPLAEAAYRLKRAPSRTGYPKGNGNE